MAGVIVRCLTTAERFRRQPVIGVFVNMSDAVLSTLVDVAFRAMYLSDADSQAPAFHDFCARFDSCFL